MKTSVKIYTNSLNELKSITQKPTKWINPHLNNQRNLAKYILSKINDFDLIDTLEKFEALPSKGNKYRNKLQQLTSKYVDLQEEFLNSITKEVINIHIANVVFEYDGRVIKKKDFEKMAEMVVNVGSAVKVVNNKAYYLKIVKYET